MTSISRRNQPPSTSPSRTLPSSPRPPSSNRQNSSVTSANGLGRSPSLRATNGLSRPVRGSVKRSSNTGFPSTDSNVSDEDDARAENLNLLEELKDRLQKAESTSTEYQRQLGMLQTRLDESMYERGKLDDSARESEARVHDLGVENMRLIRQNRDMKSTFESERTAMAQDKAEQKAREEDLMSVIQRLKAVQKEQRANGDESRELPASHSRNRHSIDMENGQFAPPSSLQRSDSNASSKVIMQKDKTIEALRLELVESQVKLMELENKGGGRLQELEKALLETRITNARLMEDNESFQLLLSEKTLNGDFSKTDVMHSSSGLGSLAEELASAEGESENYKRLESEAKSLKAENKALTLYVESIIGRLLQHKEFENILEKTPDLMSGKPPPPATSDPKTDKELPPPPPPPPKDEEPQPSSLLSRARSVVAGPRRPRPLSHIFSQQSVPSAVASPQTQPSSETPTENPPSAPLTRSQSTRNSTHRRSQSEMPLVGGTPLVNQMYRGPPSGTSSAMMSPGLSPSLATSTAPRSSFFNPTSSTTTTHAPPQSTIPSSRTPSGITTSTLASTTRNPHSSSNSTFSSSSNPNNNKDPAEITSTSSPPRNPSGGSAHGPQYTGAVMTQNRLRPLRLVQENAGDGSEEEREREREREKARKKANRGSWMPGWMGRAAPQGEGGMF